MQTLIGLKARAQTCVALALMALHEVQWVIQSYAFSGPTNTVGTGATVPVIYGK